MKPTTTTHFKNLIKSLQIEKSQLQTQLKSTQKELNNIKLQYKALEEDFLHAIDNEEIPNLKGKKIVYIGGLSKWQDQYQAIARHYQGELIVPDSNNIEAVCEAIEMADEVICPKNCPNQKLCHAAHSSCTKFNKTLRSIADRTPQSLQQELSDIAIEIQRPTLPLQ